MVVLREKEEQIQQLLDEGEKLSKTQLIREMSQKSQSTGKRLVWVDCEMTGLDVKVDKLLEIAVIVTDGNLETVRSLLTFINILIIIDNEINRFIKRSQLWVH